MITSDNHIIITKRSASQDFEGGTWSASFEEQTDPDRMDQSVFDTYYRALTDTEELRLTILPSTLRLVAIQLEPEVNGIGFITAALCAEKSTDVGPRLLGMDKTEFDPDNPIDTIPLESPDAVLEAFFASSLPGHGPITWHGTSRLRLIAAMCYSWGYPTAIDRLDFTAKLHGL